MARPIKETPVLTGKNAEEFEKAIKENESEDRKVSRETYERALEVYRSVTWVPDKKV